MPAINYRRTPEELREQASMFWPAELSEREAELSVIPKLLETQDQFIAILSVEVPNIENLFQLIQSAAMSKNLFLKHLMVLSDVGGEPLQRINQQFSILFPLNELQYWYNGQQVTYHFTTLPINGTLNNQKLGVDGKKLLEQLPLSNLLKDVIVLLIFGSSCVNEEVANNSYLRKCEISNYLGRVDELNRYIKQRYIFVSRQIKGATSNSLGQLAQTYVKEYLEQHLNIQGIEILPGGSIPGIEQGENEDTSFDLVIKLGNRYVAIEVMFQETTNSVIERKSGQARSRHEQIEAAGYRIAYVIDGAGSFARESALNRLCSHSDCTVAFKTEEFELLCQFITEYFSQPNTA